MVHLLILHPPVPQIEIRIEPPAHRQHHLPVSPASRDGGIPPSRQPNINAGPQSRSDGVVQLPPPDAARGQQANAIDLWQGVNRLQLRQAAGNQKGPVVPCPAGAGVSMKRSRLLIRHRGTTIAFAYRKGPHHTDLPIPPLKTPACLAAPGKLLGCRRLSPTLPPLFRTCHDRYY